MFYISAGFSRPSYLKFKMAPTMYHLPEAPLHKSIIFLGDRTMVIGADFRISPNNWLLTNFYSYFNLWYQTTLWPYHAHLLSNYHLQLEFVGLFHCSSFCQQYHCWGCQCYHKHGHFANLCSFLCPT